MTKDTTKREALASRLRLAREQAGLSQGQVAKILEMHRPTISEIEAGRRRVSAEEVSEFARTYDVSVSWLVSEQDEGVEDVDRLRLVARELSKLKQEDIEKILRLLRMLGSGEEKA